MMPGDLEPLEPLHPSERCTCIHGPQLHDPTTGACLRINIMHGPCPCEATPEETRTALVAVWKDIRKNRG